MKIALIGSAPSSRDLAPVNDPTWDIWACSPGTMGLSRIDEFFELHSIETMANQEENTLYLAWMRTRKRVWLQNAEPRFKNSVRFPAKEMIDLYGRWFFASTISWMFAFAISKKPTQIGLWGIDMSATDEYGHQRTACQFFIHEARRQGIEVVIPPEADIQYPLPLYGYYEADPVWVKQNARYKELSSQLKAMADQRAKLDIRMAMMQGAIDDLNYQMRTFIQGPVSDPDQQEGVGGADRQVRWGSSPTDRWTVLTA